MQSLTANETTTRLGSPALWYALFGGATAWFTGLCVAYFIVTPSCRTGTEAYLHTVSAITIVAGVGAAATGALLWRPGRSTVHDDGGGRRDRSRFLAAIGTVLSGLFVLVMLAQWAAAVSYGPCEHFPRLRDSPDALVQPVDAARPV